MEGRETTSSKKNNVAGSSVSSASNSHINPDMSSIQRQLDNKKDKSDELNANNKLADRCNGDNKDNNNDINDPAPVPKQGLDDDDDDRGREKDDEEEESIATKRNIIINSFVDRNNSSNISVLLSRSNSASFNASTSTCSQERVNSDEQEDYEDEDEDDENLDELEKLICNELLNNRNDENNIINFIDDDVTKSSNSSSSFIFKKKPNPNKALRSNKILKANNKSNQTTALSKIVNSAPTTEIATNEPVINKSETITTTTKTMLTTTTTTLLSNSEERINDDDDAAHLITSNSPYSSFKTSTLTRQNQHHQQQQQQPSQSSIIPINIVQNEILINDELHKQPNQPKLATSNSMNGRVNSHCAKRFSDNTMSVLKTNKSNSNKSLNTINDHQVLSLAPPLGVDVMQSSHMPTSQKKIVSNLKKTPSNAPNAPLNSSITSSNGRTRPSGGEKVKFSDIELHHMIGSSKDGDSAANQASLYSPTPGDDDKIEIVSIGPEIYAQYVPAGTSGSNVANSKNIPQGVTMRSGVKAPTRPNKRTLRHSNTINVFDARPSTLAARNYANVNSLCLDESLKHEKPRQDQDQVLHAANQVDLLNNYYHLTKHHRNLKSDYDIKYTNNYTGSSRCLSEDDTSTSFSGSCTSSSSMTSFSSCSSATSSCYSDDFDNLIVKNQRGKSVPNEAAYYEQLKSMANGSANSSVAANNGSTAGASNYAQFYEIYSTLPANKDSKQPSSSRHSSHRHHRKKHHRHKHRHSSSRHHHKHSSSSHHKHHHKHHSHHHHHHRHRHKSKKSMAAEVMAMAMANPNFYGTLQNNLSKYHCESGNRRSAHDGSLVGLNLSNTALNQSGASKQHRLSRVSTGGVMGSNKELESAGKSRSISSIQNIFKDPQCSSFTLVNNSNTNYSAGPNNRVPSGCPNATGSSNSIFKSLSNKNLNQSNYSNYGSQQPQSNLIKPIVTGGINYYAPGEQPAPATLNSTPSILVTKQLNHPNVIKDEITNYSKMMNMISAKRAGADVPAMNGQQSNLNELMVENTSTFIDSPIHILMNHHKNQRALKQQKQEKDYQRTNNDVLMSMMMNNNTCSSQLNDTRYSSSGTLNVTSATSQLASPTPIKPLQQIDEVKPLQLPAGQMNSNQNAAVKFNASKKTSLAKSGKFIALIFTSLIILASIYLLEIISCIIKANVVNLMVFKLSSSFFSFLFVFFAGFKWNCKPQGDVTIELNDKRSLAAVTTDNEENSEGINQMRNMDLKYYNIFQAHMTPDMTSSSSGLKERQEENNSNVTVEGEQLLNNSLKLDQPQSHVLNDSDNQLHKLNITYPANGDEKKKLIKTAKLKSSSISNAEVKFKLLVDFLYNPKQKSNFYSFIISLLLIHFWILSTYLTGYLFSPTVYSILVGTSSKTATMFNNSQKFIASTGFGSFIDLSLLVEVLAAIVGGFGAALFFKNIILSLYESSFFLNKYRKDSYLNSCEDTKFSDLEDSLRKFANIDPSQKLTKTDMLVLLFKSHHKEIMRNYMQTMLKYFIGIQANFLLATMFMVYIIFIVNGYSVDKIFNQVCMDTIANATRSQICPSLLARNLFFNWKNEMLQRKLALQANARRLESSVMIKPLSSVGHYSAMAQQGAAAAADTITPTSISSTVSNAPSNQNYLGSKFSPVEDIYLLLISVSLINFFISLVVPLIFIKANTNAKQARVNSRVVQNLEEKVVTIAALASASTSKTSTPKQSDSARKKSAAENTNEIGEEADESDSGGFMNTNNKSIAKKIKPKLYKQTELALIHLMMPLVFFQGFIRTILFNELNKWYSGCLSGTNHLTKLLFCYGLGSFASIVLLAVFIIVFNLKRSILFLLVFIQQTTLIVLLFYWDPLKPSIEFKNYYIDYVFFVCFAVCENFWLVHNIRALLAKSYEMNKSPCVILLYAYSIFALGSFFGYAISIYFCFPLKLYTTLIFLSLFSLVYSSVEIFYYFKR